jgi:hypothetical protein
MQCLEFIKKNGQSKFIKIAEKWRGPFVKLELDRFGKSLIHQISSNTIQYYQCYQ